MRAITVAPGTADSVRLDEVAEPDAAEGAVLVETLAVGVCGTDREIIAGQHGQPPPGRDRLVLGHESLGQVVEAPTDSGLTVGDLVVGIVRRPDPEPCVNCAVGEWDMCRNGRFTEHGIKGLDGFARERFRIDPAAIVPVEPTLGVCPAHTSGDAPGGSHAGSWSRAPGRSACSPPSWPVNAASR